LTLSAYKDKLFKTEQGLVDKWPEFEEKGIKELLQFKDETEPLDTF